MDKRFEIIEDRAEVREIDTDRPVFMPDLIEESRAKVKAAAEDAGSTYEIREKGPAKIIDINDYRLADVIPLFPDQDI